jgi:hypothetical protein
MKSEHGENRGKAKVWSTDWKEMKSDTKRSEITINEMKW